VKDDSDDYVAAVFHEWQQAMAEGRNFEFPENMTDDEMAKLGVLVSENDAPVQPPLPRYATGVMPPGLSEDEALRQALQDSAAPQPPPYNPWAPPPQPQPWAPPPPPPPPPQLPPPLHGLLLLQLGELHAVHRPHHTAREPASVEASHKELCACCLHGGRHV
jgi:hypothetical protein